MTATLPSACEADYAIGPRQAFGLVRAWLVAVAVIVVSWQGVSWLLVSRAGGVDPWTDAPPSLWSAVPVVALSIALVGLVAVGRRWEWAVVGFVALLAGWSAELPAMVAAAHSTWVEHPEMRIEVIRYLLGGDHLANVMPGGRIVELVVAGTPAFVLRKVTTHRRGWFLTRARLVSLSLCGMIAVIVAVAAYQMDPWPIRFGPSIRHAASYLSLFLIGAGIGTSHRWWPWVPLMSGVAGASAASNAGRGGTAYIVALVLTPLIASFWEPMAERIERATSVSPLIPLVLLNLLNVADALLTHWAVGSGRASEANPVIDAIGLPAKVVFVGLAGWLVYRLRPEALWWPTAALAAVFIWHMLGLGMLA